MCGRYSLTSRLDQLLPRLGGALPAGLAEHYAPRPQVRPGEPVLALRRERDRPEAAHLIWGLLPAWARDPRRSRPINARSETVHEKPSFRGAWRHRRCLLPADGFYEWSGPRGSPDRRPWWIHRRDGAPFWLGGIWERWLGADGSELETCAVLTTRPNALIAPLHDRMPVVVPDGLEQAWLAPVAGAELQALRPVMEPWDPARWQAEPAAR